MHDCDEQKGRYDGQRVRKIKYIDNSIIPLPRPRGHARQIRPVKGGQRPGMQWEGVAGEVPLSWPLYLPRPAKCHLRATGDGPQLQSVQVPRSQQPQRNIVGFLCCQSINTPQHVNIWAHRFWRYHPSGHHVDHHLPKSPRGDVRCVME